MFFLNQSKDNQNINTTSYTFDKSPLIIYKYAKIIPFFLKKKSSAKEKHKKSLSLSKINIVKWQNL